MYGKLGETVEETKTIASDTGDPEVYTTAYLFDTWGRLQQLTYPDGEVLTYSYDSGGLPRAASGIKEGVTTAYVTRLEYDQFEQRVFTKMGNGIETNQTYDPLDRRPATIKAGAFQDVSFLYDDVGNVTDVKNNVPPAPQNTLGGKVTQQFEYDGLYRLKKATGSWQYEPEKNDQYEMLMSYNKIHNITQKKQTHTVTKSGKDPKVQAKTTYDWAYAYAGPHPHAPATIGDRTFTHDLNGNQTGWQDPNNSQDRTIAWDEENRIQSVAENGHTTTFKYNDAGERVMKSGDQGELAYVNQFWTVRNKTEKTKHIFVGSSRLVSKVASGGGNGGDESAFYYHADHLGSTSFVTDDEGELYEHAQYFPFGEQWVLQQGNQSLPYLFTSKELDEETGLYYFGARYLDGRAGQWLSPDPAFNDHVGVVEESRGIYTPANLALFSYTVNNPLVMKDPDGRDWFKVDGKYTFYPGKTFRGQKGSEYLVEFVKTGVTENGAVVGTLTLYRQLDVIAEDKSTFSGGNGRPADDGTYNINLTVRNEPRFDKKGQLKVHWGIERFPDDIKDKSGTPHPEVLQTWGSMRARLLPSEGEDRGLYLHGKGPVYPKDVTHGCICHRSEDVLNALYGLDYTKTQLVPVQVRTAPPPEDK
jgi:RHS repeat-associated protein